MFWRLKGLYPGDPDFSWVNYSSLPWPYVVNAFTEGNKLYRERLHDTERPVAMISSLLANQNRDPKKNKKGFSYEDFSFYRPTDGGDVADYVYGSAMLQMAKKGTLPAWTMFCYKEVVAAAQPDYVPSLCALVAEDAILLHPEKTATGWSGMLIASESASEQKRTFKADDGTTVKLAVPHIHTKYIAEEDVTLFNY